MKSNAMKKQATIAYHYNQDNFKHASEPYKILQFRITEQSVDPVVADDKYGPDLGAFEEKYLLGASSFA